MKIYQKIKDYPERIRTSNNYLEALFLFIILQLLVSRLGLIFKTQSEVSMIWPATGMGISLLLVFGIRFWPATALASLLSSVISGNNFLATIGLMFANTAEAIIGVLILIQLNKIRFFGDIHRFSISLIIGVIVASLVSATIGISSLCIIHAIDWNSFSTNWMTWFTANSLGGIIICPFVLSIFKPEEKFERSGFLKAILICAIGAVITWLLFFNIVGAPYIFLIFPFILVSNIFLDAQSSKFLGILLLFGAITFSKFGATVNFYGHDNRILPLQIFLFFVSINNLFILDFKSNGSMGAPSIVLLFGWIISGMLFYAFFTSDYQKNLSKLNEIAGLALNDINSQLVANSVSLRSGVGLVAANKSLKRNDWNEFVNKIDIIKSQTGMRGMGVVFRVPNSAINKFEKENKFDGAMDFKVHGLPNFDIKLPESYIIAYISPLAPNLKAQGLDLAVEPNRKTAADTAADSGELSITKSIALVQDKTKSEGFLFFYPLYSNGAAPITVQERRLRNIGWVYAPIRAKDFFATALSDKMYRDISYSISEQDTGKVLTTSADYLNLSNRNMMNYNFKMANRNYVFSVRPSALFIWDNGLTSMWVASISLFATLILASFISFIKSSEKRANILVDERTKQLDIERAKSVQASKLAALGEMSAGIAHEINNPLTIIQAHIGMLIGKLEAGPVPQDAILTSVIKIGNTSDRIGKIIKGLRSIARDGEGDPFEAVSVQKLADDVVSLSQNKMKNSGIKIIVNLPIENIRVECSEVQISQVLLNLVNNSHDAIIGLNPKWIIMEVKIIRDGSFLEFSITDCGTGVPKEYADKLMQPFFTTKDVGKGTGLGLSISRGIIDQHNGKFYLDQNNANTRFVFEIPIKNKRA